MVRSGKSLEAMTQPQKDAEILVFAEEIKASPSRLKKALEEVAVLMSTYDNLSKCAMAVRKK